MNPTKVISLANTVSGPSQVISTVKLRQSGAKRLKEIK